MEVLLGEMGLVGVAGHFCYQGAASIGKGLPGSPIPIGSITNGLLHFHDGIGHRGMFSLPKFLRDTLRRTTRVITQDQPLLTVA